MKKRYFIPLLIVFAFFGVFFAEKSAFGAYLINQNSGNTQAEAFAPSAKSFLRQTNLTSYLSAFDDSQPFSISIKTNIDPRIAYTSGARSSMNIQCSEGLFGLSVGQNGISFDSSYNSETNIATVNFYDNFFDVFGGSCTNPSSIEIGYATWSAPYFRIYGATSDLLTDSDAMWLTNTHATTGSDANITDMYLVVEQGPNDTVGFTFPENATSTPDFSHFRLNWNVAEEMENRGIIIVNYSQSESKALADTPEETADCFYNRNGCFRDVLVLENEMASSTDTALFKHVNLSPNLWYAHAELFRDYDAPDWIFLASSTINFTITTAPQIDTFWEIPTSTITTSTPAQITCDPDDPFFQYSFCKLFLYLLVPQSDSFDKFSTLGQEIENKPPIGYFTQIKSVLSNVNASGTPVFDIGNYSAFSSSIFTPLRTGISWLLWLFFAVVIFNRVRHLEL